MAQAAVVNVLDEVRAAWRGKLVTAVELSERVAKTPETITRSLNGKIDPPYSVAMAYYEAWKAIEAERDLVSGSGVVAEVAANDFECGVPAGFGGGRLGGRASGPAGAVPGLSVEAKEREAVRLDLQNQRLAGAEDQSLVGGGLAVDVARLLDRAVAMGRINGELRELAVRTADVILRVDLRAGRSNTALRAMSEALDYVSHGGVDRVPGVEAGTPRQRRLLAISEGLAVWSEAG